MQIIKQSTAVDIPMGPFLDEDDGKTAEVGLAIAQADIRLSKNGGAFAQTNNAAGAAHDENGWYIVPLNATDTNTLGQLTVAIHEGGALPVWEVFLIVTANIYNSFCSTDILQADLIQMGGVAQSGTDLKDFADAGYDPGTNKVQGVVLVDNVTTLTGHTPQTGNNFTRLGAPAAASIAADLVIIDTVVDAVKAKTDLRPSGIPKGVAITALPFLMVDDTDHVTPELGKVITEEISKDGGAFAPCANAFAEIGNGMYKIDLTAGEMAADIVILKFTAAGCDQTIIPIVTST